MSAPKLATQKVQTFQSFNALKTSALWRVCAEGVEASGSSFSRLTMISWRCSVDRYHADCGSSAKKNQQMTPRQTEGIPSIMRSLLICKVSARECFRRDWDHRTVKDYTISRPLTLEPHPYILSHKPRCRLQRQRGQQQQEDTQRELRVLFSSKKRSNRLPCKGTKGLQPLQGAHDRRSIGCNFESGPSKLQLSPKEQL